MSTKTQAAREKFISRFNTRRDAVEFEGEALSIGREFLPPCALKVRDGGNATVAYFRWLESQIAE